MTVYPVYTLSAIAALIARIQQSFHKFSEVNSDSAAFLECCKRHIFRELITDTEFKCGKPCKQRICSTVFPEAYKLPAGIKSLCKEIFNPVFIRIILNIVRIP